MYNDYYLQEINTKMGTLCTNTEQIITNQETINTTIKEMGSLITMACIMYVLLYFIVRSLK